MEVKQEGNYQRKREEGGIGGKDKSWLGEQIKQGEGHEEEKHGKVVTIKNKEKDKTV